MISHKENHYIVKNSGYNSNISPKESIKIGFRGVGGKDTNSIYNQKLYSYKLDSKVVLPDESETETIIESETETVTESETETVTEGESEIQEPTSLVDITDTDGDELPDFYEDVIGTDKFNIDTDGDGLPDGYELLTTMTNPLIKDSDNNGISDGDEDFDEDGLSNLREYILMINPMDFDTDGDGIGDYNEIELGLNPNNQVTYETEKVGVKKKSEKKEAGYVYQPITIEEKQTFWGTLAAIAIVGAEAYESFINKNPCLNFLLNIYLEGLKSGGKA